MSTKQTEERVRELTSFIEALTARFKANQSTFSDRLEVSDKDLVLLRALASGGPMIIRALGGRFGVPVSTMTGLVDRMEKKGLVRRVRHREDRRAIELGRHRRERWCSASTAVRWKRSRAACSKRFPNAIKTR
jgi:DNA-binding Lrp family transcriptional regulator